MSTASSSPSAPRELYLLGVGVGHSVAPRMHNHIAKSLDLPWTFHTKETPTIEDCMKVLRSETCAGVAITMPYKGTIMDRLDEVDVLASTMAACNTVSVGADSKLRGTNVDWNGIAGSLEEGSVGLELPTKKAALIIGAGGAARAAIYALSAQMSCTEIYVFNRDRQEVLDLEQDVSTRYAFRPSITHVESVEQARSLPTPTYIVGTVPDFEPATPAEKCMKRMLVAVLQKEEKGVVLDMCYKPRRTRHIKLGQQYGWRTIEGIRVIGHQAEHQWRAWVGNERVQAIDREGMWKCLQQSADESLL
ncbi:hypothetical protein LTR17_027586, partial [Elasticomyces elasticus]